MILLLFGCFIFKFDRHHFIMLGSKSCTNIELVRCVEAGAQDWQLRLLDVISRSDPFFF